MRARVLIVVAAIAAAAFAAGASFVPHGGTSVGVGANGEPQVKAFDGVRDIAPFSLTDHRGQRFDRERLLGRWTVVTFGFTGCPDACPTMLSNLAELKKSLLLDWTGAEPQFVLITVDPARDTQKVLAQYVPSFDPAFSGITGTQREVDRVHADFGGAHRIPAKAKAHDHADGQPHEHYTVDHSLLLYVVNPEGRLHAQISPPFDPAGVARSIARHARDFAATQRGVTG
jgi:protein SCO1